MTFRLSVLVLLLAPSLAAAQATPPVWAKADNFWYRKTVPGGNLWLNVDALHGAKEPLFDHQRLAIELTLRSGIQFTPLTLPFADSAAQFVVKYDGSNAYIQQGAMAIEFVLDGSHWRCELQIKWDWNKVPPTDYECTRRRPFVPGFSPAALRADTAARVSPDGRWQAFIRNHNIALRGVGDAGPVHMLTADGTPLFAYQLGSIRWSSDSQSLSAYRVSEQIWNSNSVTANVKGLVMKGEWTVPVSQRIFP